jgi:molecular chaperone HscB
MPVQQDNAPNTPPAKCTTCRQPLLSPVVCDNCHRLYPAAGRSHFELLGLTPTFDLDLAAVRRMYLQVSRGIHPDYHGTGAEADMSLHLSAQLNEAHRVLTDPVLRAEYLLELHGGHTAIGDRSVLDGILVDALELREEIAAATAGGDPATLQTCRTDVQRRFATILDQISLLARQLPGDDQLRLKLRATLNSIKYYQRLLTEL